MMVHLHSVVVLLAFGEGRADNLFALVVEKKKE